MSTTQYTVTDERVPVKPSQDELATRVPRGAFVAYNGPSDDGERRRAIVLSHGDDGTSLTVLDGSNEVVVSGAELESVIVLAASADAYAQRVTSKAQTLGREYNWCEVANTAIAELNSTPAEGDVRRTLKFVVTTVSEITALPTRDGRRLMERNGLDFVAKNALYVNGAEFNSSYFRHQREGTNVRKSVTVQVVDEFPTDVSTDASSSS